MVCRDREDLRLLGEDEPCHQVWLVDRQQDDGHVEAARQHVAERVAQRELSEVHRDSRVVPLEGGDGPRDRLVDDALEPHPEGCRQVAGTGLRLLHHAHECSVGRCERREKIGPEVGQLHAAARARYQLCADPPLEGADQLADPALGEEHPFRGASEVQLFGEDEEALDLARRKLWHVAPRSPAQPSVEPIVRHR